MAPLGRKIRFRVEKAVVGEGYPKLALEASSAISAGSHICMNL